MEGEGPNLLAEFMAQNAPEETNSNRDTPSGGPSLLQLLQKPVYQEPNPSHSPLLSSQGLEPQKNLVSSTSSGSSPNAAAAYGTNRLYELLPQNNYTEVTPSSTPEPAFVSLSDLFGGDAAQSTPVLNVGGGGKDNGSIEKDDDRNEGKYPGTYLATDDVLYVSGKSEDKETLEVTPITLYKRETSLSLGSHIAVNDDFMCYAVKDTIVRIIQISTAKRDLLRGHSEPITDMRFSSSRSRILATSGVDGTVMIWKLFQESNGEVTHKALVKLKMLQDTHAARIVWHPETKSLEDPPSIACVTNSNSIVIFFLNDPLLNLNTPTSAGTTRVIKAKEAGSYAKIFKTTNKVLHAAFSPDGRQLAACDISGTVTLWNIKSGSVVHSLCPFVESPQPLYWVSFISAHLLLIGGEFNSTLRIWDLKMRKTRMTLRIAAAHSQYIHLNVDELNEYIFGLDAQQPIGYAIHINKESARFDYIAEYDVAHPVLSFSILNVQPSASPDGQITRGGEHQLYCVQPNAIQMFHIPFAKTQFNANNTKRIYTARDRLPTKIVDEEEPAKNLQSLETEPSRVEAPKEESEVEQAQVEETPVNPREPISPKILTGVSTDTHEPEKHHTNIAEMEESKRKSSEDQVPEQLVRVGVNSFTDGEQKSGEENYSVQDVIHAAAGAFETDPPQNVHASSPSRVPSDTKIDHLMSPHELLLNAIGLAQNNSAAKSPPPSDAAAQNLNTFAAEPPPILNHRVSKPASPVLDSLTKAPASIPDQAFHEESEMRPKQYFPQIAVDTIPIDQPEDKFVQQNTQPIPVAASSSIQSPASVADLELSFATMIKTAMDHLYTRVESERKQREKLEREKQEKLLQAIATTFQQKINAMEKTLKAEVQASVSGATVKAIEKLSKTVSEAKNANVSIPPAQLNKITETVKASVEKSLTQDMSNVVKTHYQNTLIPAFEKAVREMGSQIEESFKKTIEQTYKNVSTAAQAETTASMASAVKDLNEMTLNLVKFNKTVVNDLASIDKKKEDKQEFKTVPKTPNEPSGKAKKKAQQTQGHQQPVPQTAQNQPQPQPQQALQPTQVPQLQHLQPQAVSIPQPSIQSISTPILSTLISQPGQDSRTAQTGRQQPFPQYNPPFAPLINPTPSTFNPQLRVVPQHTVPTSPQPQPQAALQSKGLNFAINSQSAAAEQYASIGQYEDALNVVLSVGSLPVVIRLLNQLDPEKVMQSKLNDCVILSLVQQLSYDLSTDTLVKLKWLSKCMNILDVNAPEIKVAVKTVFNQALANLKALLDSGEKDPTARQLFHVVNSMIIMMGD